MGTDKLARLIFELTDYGNSVEAIEMVLAIARMLPLIQVENGNPIRLEFQLVVDSRAFPFDNEDYAYILRGMAGTVVGNARIAELGERMKAHASSIEFYNERSNRRDVRGRDTDPLYDKAYAQEQQGKPRSEAFEEYCKARRITVPDQRLYKAYIKAMARRRKGHKGTK